MLINFEDTIHSARNALNSIAVTGDIFPLVNDNTALTGRTDHILAILHQLQAIELLINTVRNGVQLIWRVGAFLDIINGYRAIETAGDNVGVI